MGRSSGRSRASHATAPVTNAVGRCGSPKRRYSIARSTSGPMAWSSTLRRASWPQSSASTCRRVALWPFSEDPHDSIAVRRVRPAHRPKRPHHGGPPRRVSRRERRGIPRPRRRVSRRHRARARSRRLADARRLRGRGVQPRTPEQELRPDGAERRPDRVRDVVLRSGGSTAGTGPRVAVTPRRRPVLLTLRGGNKTDLPTPPAYLVERLDEGASTGQQVRRHRERVDAADAAPRTHQGVAELAALATEEKMQSGFRAARGLALFEPMLRAKLG